LAVDEQAVVLFAMVVACGSDTGLLGLSFETFWLDYEAFGGG
jgi:hypothetical protein